jgi:hypothetical protein
VIEHKFSMQEVMGKEGRERGREGERERKEGREAGREGRVGTGGSCL